MSGPLPARVASHATRIAYVAKARAALAAFNATVNRQGLPNSTWAAMSMKTRITLVMLGGTKDGNPKEIAAQPWESMPVEDRISIGVCARELARDLRFAASLF